MHLPVRFLALTALWLVPSGGGLCAADVVRIAPAEGDGPAFGIDGRILEYTGREIVVLPARGTERRFPADRVVEIQTSWPGGYEEGLRALDEQDYAAAAQHLTAANRAESRTWARRIILARLARAMQGQGKLEQSADVVLAILASDPASPHFNLLPLAWAGAARVPSSKADAWLKEAERPAASLLGASHLLATRQGDSIAVLRRLTAAPDARIAAMAEAQLWRTQVANADEAEVARWQAAVAKMPSGLRAGPFFVVGQALRRLGHRNEAALAFLRVPIHAPQAGELSARALLAAAECVHQAGHPEEAIRLAEEILASYADTPSAGPAEKLMQELTQ